MTFGETIENTQNLVLEIICSVFFSSVVVFEFN